MAADGDKALEAKKKHNNSFMLCYVINTIITKLNAKAADGTAAGSNADASGCSKAVAAGSSADASGCSKAMAADGTAAGSNADASGCSIAVASDGTAAGSSADGTAAGSAAAATMPHFLGEVPKQVGTVDMQMLDCKFKEFLCQHEAMMKKPEGPK